MKFFLRRRTERSFFLYDQLLRTPTPTTTKNVFFSKISTTVPASTPPHVRWLRRPAPHIPTFGHPTPADFGHFSADFGRFLANFGHFWSFLPIFGPKVHGFGPPHRKPVPPSNRRLWPPHPAILAENRPIFGQNGRFLTNFQLFFGQI